MTALEFPANGSQTDSPTARACRVLRRLDLVVNPIRLHSLTNIWETIPLSRRTQLVLASQKDMVLGHLEPLR
jgi:hypothetical protein